MTDADTLNIGTYIDVILVQPFTFPLLVKLTSTHMVKFAEIFLQLHWFVYYKVRYLVCYTLCSFHSKDGHETQKRKKVTLGVQDDTKGTLVHEKSTRMKSHKYLQYVIFDNFSVACVQKSQCPILWPSIASLWWLIFVRISQISVKKTAT